MGFTKTGDWEKVTKLVANLSAEMQKAREISLKRFGLKVEGLAVGHISKQDLDWKPLKAATISAKVRKGMSENILVETSDYFQAITSYVKDETAYAGVKKEAKNRDGDIIHNIAAVHEYGSRSGNIPARPLWKPSFDEGIKWHFQKNLPEKIFAKRIEKYFR